MSNNGTRLHQKQSKLHIALEQVDSIYSDYQQTQTIKHTKADSAWNIYLSPSKLNAATAFLLTDYRKYIAPRPP